MLLSSASKLNPKELFPMLQMPELSELFPLPPPPFALEDPLLPLLFRWSCMARGVLELVCEVEEVGDFLLIAEGTTRADGDSLVVSIVFYDFRK